MRMLKEKILIIESDTKYAYKIKENLLNNDYMVDLSLDGIYGIHLFKINDYNLVILSSSLFKTTGLYVLKRLKEIKNTKILYLVSGIEKTKYEDYSKFNIVSFLSKPFDIGMLTNMIDTILKE